jgi:hypothetical protein
MNTSNDFLYVLLIYFTRSWVLIYLFIFPILEMLVTSFMQIIVTYIRMSCGVRYWFFFQWMWGIDYDEAFEIYHWTLDVYSYAMFHFEPCLNVGIFSTVCVRMVEVTRRTSPSTSLPPGHWCKSLAMPKSISVGWWTQLGGSAAASTMLCRPLIYESPRCICTCARIMHKYTQNQQNWYTAKKKGS